MRKGLEISEQTKLEFIALKDLLLKGPALERSRHINSSKARKGYADHMRDSSREALHK